MAERCRTRRRGPMGLAHPAVVGCFELISGADDTTVQANRRVERSAGRPRRRTCGGGRDHHALPRRILIVPGTLRPTTVPFRR